MNTCPDTSELQDWLDGQLSPGESARLEAHVASCVACAAEVDAYRAVFAGLDTLPLLEPSPELHARILDAVLPHRVPRWVRIAGGLYVGSLVASAAAIVVALLLPGPSDWIHGVFASGMSAFARGGVFLMRSVTETLAQAGVALRFETVVVLVQPLVGGLARVDCAALARCQCWRLRCGARRPHATSFFLVLRLSMPTDPSVQP